MPTNDLNLIVLCGRVASEPDVDPADHATRRLRMIVAVRSESPRSRVDMLPITMWDPPDELVGSLPEVGSSVFVVGSIQRRVDSEWWGRSSRIEVVALSLVERSRLARPVSRCD
jgi:hypothetical protein